MIFQHILLDMVSDFLKGSKRGFKQNYIWTYFLPSESLIGCNKNLCRPLKTFVCVSLRYRKRCGGSVEIVVVVCGKNCGNICSKMCGKIEKIVGLEQKLVW